MPGTWFLGPQWVLITSYTPSVTKKRAQHNSAWLGYTAEQYIREPLLKVVLKPSLRFALQNEISRAVMLKF